MELTYFLNILVLKLKYSHIDSSENVIEITYTLVLVLVYNRLWSILQSITNTKQTTTDYYSHCTLIS